MNERVEGNSIPFCQGPNPDPGTPIHSTPSEAWDCHAHIFGPVEQYPFTPNRSFTPPEASLAAYRRMLAALGIAHAVIVQPSVYGTDNRCTLDAVAAAGGGWRGVAVVDPSVSEQELERLHAAGFRGVRVNVLFRGGLTLDALERLAHTVAPLGWHLQLLLDGRDLVELAPRLRRLPVQIVIDHMGHMPASAGVEHPGFQILLQLVREGRCWAKLSGAYRLSGGPYYPYHDVVPFARALIEADASHMVWGSDWPHPAVSGSIPKDAGLLDLLAVWAPDAEVRRRILTENPAQLYGFSAAEKGPTHRSTTSLAGG
ncbi:MAG: amidohydrolase family protein [Terriglobales bacterium]|jgi:predicted TIM-barrel fold metal-dependent hydrolase